MIKRILCKLNFHKKKELSCGYPAYSKCWLTTYRCERCGLRINEWDDLFAEPRPKDYPLHLDFMIETEDRTD